MDGPTFYEGRLEVCVDNQWQTVCEEGFNMAVATSACRDRILLTGSRKCILSYLSKVQIIHVISQKERLSMAMLMALEPALHSQHVL